MEANKANQMPTRVNKLNKTRDSIMLPRSGKHSLLNSGECTVAYAGDTTTANDNFTNVTNFSQWITTNESKFNFNNEEDDEEDDDQNRKEEDDSNSNEKTYSKLMKDEKYSMHERSMPNDTALPPPKRLASFTINDETTNQTNATIYTGANNCLSMMTYTTCPTPSVTYKLSETRKLIDNVFNQTDSDLTNENNFTATNLSNNYY